MLEFGEHKVKQTHVAVEAFDSFNKQRRNTSTLSLVPHSFYPQNVAI